MTKPAVLGAKAQRRLKMTKKMFEQCRTHRLPYILRAWVRNPNSAGNEMNTHSDKGDTTRGPVQNANRNMLLVNMVEKTTRLLRTRTNLRGKATTVSLVM
jgi:DhnA family fructose-bisphosphate aldolase class Ia